MEDFSQAVGLIHFAMTGTNTTKRWGKGCLGLLMLIAHEKHHVCVRNKGGLDFVHYYKLFVVWQ